MGIKTLWNIYCLDSIYPQYKKICEENGVRPKSLDEFMDKGLKKIGEEKC